MDSPTAGEPAADRLLWVKRLALIAGSAALVMAGFEVLLALRAIRLSEAASRYVYGCYEPSQPDRYIHATARPLRVRLHRPDFEADCYFFGYSWRHLSDGYGFRNPETWERADVVLLGDSMVYGHGVEENQTTAHFLRELLGRRVVNLGVTGGSPVHAVAHLRNFALPLEPQAVVAFTFSNDLEDIRGSRSTEELERFVRTGEGRETRIVARATLLEKLRVPGGHEPLFFDRFAVYRLLEFRLRAWRPSRPAPLVAGESRVPGEGTGSQRPAPSDEALERLEGRIAVAYLRRAVAIMAESCRAADAALVVGHLGRDREVDWLLRKVLRESAAELGIHYFAAPVLDYSYRLPEDGHLSEAGHRRLAEMLAVELEERIRPARVTGTR